MKVLVYPALMEIGGSQLNAIELAAQMSGAGHEVVLFAPSGDLNEVATAQGLEVVRSPSERRWPNPRTIATLTRLVRRRGIEIVHGYEWGPSVELALGPYALLGTPMITTVMSMDVPDLIPTTSPLVVGTAELAAEQTGIRTAHLAEPWIDTAANRPEVTDRAATRARLGLADDDTVLVVVCRLTDALEKAPGVLAAIEAVHALNQDEPNADHDKPTRHRLVVVGDGDQLETVRARAAAANTEAGFEETVVTGPMIDPRAAYDVADVMLGMGSSALKGLSFGKPLVVQGTGGYWRAFGPDTVEVFDHQGFFGHGTASTTAAGAAELRAALAPLLALDPAGRAALGALGRNYIVAGFSLDAAAQDHLELYAGILAAPPSAADRVQTFVRTARESAKLNAALALGARRAARTAVAAPAAVPGLVPEAARAGGGGDRT